MERSALLAVSPVDGRYWKVCTKLAPYFSEFGLIKARVHMQIEYLIQIFNLLDPQGLSQGQQLKLRKLETIDPEDAEKIKDLEKQTNHDVAAVILWLRQILKNKYPHLVEWVHFGLTSEDCNNIAYALMFRDTIGAVLLPQLRYLGDNITNFARLYADIAMLSRTHGQPATPTTLGKEFNVFAHRLRRQLETLEEFKLQVKLSGASGNYCAHVVAFPHVDWEGFSRKFVRSLTSPGQQAFEHNEMTTQIEPHDTYAELFGIFMRINTILIDFCQDIWRYISDDWLVQQAEKGEVGSSAMPHKVNPIDFENAEGNLGLANAMMEFFCRKLPISRLQRDLSDSTVERAFGTALGHSLIAYESIIRGLNKISANEQEITRALRSHPEVVAEAYQTILRRAGYAESYNTLKELSRGKAITYQDLHDFVRGLDIPDELRKELLAVTPSNYIGLASDLAEE